MDRRIVLFALAIIAVAIFVLVLIIQTAKGPKEVSSVTTQNWSEFCNNFCSIYENEQCAKVTGNSAEFWNSHCAEYTCGCFGNRP